MSTSRDMLVAIGMMVIIAGGYMYSTRPASSHQAALRDLYASPVCLRPDGAPRAARPTVAQAWSGTIGTPIERARADFVGLRTIELPVGPSTSQRFLTFIQATAHRWRFNDDATTSAWVARICGARAGPG